MSVSRPSANCCGVSFVVISSSSSRVDDVGAGYERPQALVPAALPRADERVVHVLSEDAAGQFGRLAAGQSFAQKSCLQVKERHLADVVRVPGLDVVAQLLVGGAQQRPLLDGP